MTDVRRSNPIRVYEQSLTLVSEFDRYENAYFTSTWHGFGKFVIQVNANASGSDAFTRGRIVVFGKDTRRSGIITEVKKAQGVTGKGSQILTISGYELKFIFSWRQVLPPTAQEYYSITDSAETVIKTLVKDQCGSTADADRRFTLLEIDTDQDRGSSYLLKSRYTATVAEELNKCSVATGVGFWVYIDETNKKYRLEIGLGTDRTASQTTNPRAIFSEKYNTIREASYDETDDQYRNYAYVAGQGVGANRNVREVYSGSSEPTSFARREMFVDARDLSSNTDLDSRGGQKLQEQNIQVIVDGTPLTISPLVFKTDYDLGDLITVDVYNTPYDARVTEVKESWSPSGYSLDLTLGRQTATLPMQIARAQEATKSSLTTIEGKTEVTAIANSVATRDSIGDLFARAFESTVATGTAPLRVASTTKVTNLNCDAVDGFDTTTTREASKIAPLSSGGYLPANGVSFPATQAASADANTLDDYEEGSFTPAITFGGGNTGITYTTQVGRYTKVGREVKVEGSIVLSNKGSSTGNILITGLPFSALNYGASVCPMPIGAVNNTSFSGWLSARIIFNSTTFEVYQTTDAGTRSVLTDANFTNTSAIAFNGSYIVN